MPFLKALTDLVGLIRAKKASPFSAPIFRKDQLARAVDAGKVKLFSLSDVFWGVSSKSNFSNAQREYMLLQMAEAARMQHPHVYKLGLGGLTTNYNKSLQKSYGTMASHIMHYLKTGLHKSHHKAHAASNKPFKMDLDDRKHLLAGIKVLTDGLRQQMNAQAKQNYGKAYRKGKEHALATLKKKGVDVGAFEAISGTDLNVLGSWNDFHDEASAGLAEDIDGRMEEVLDDPNYDSEKDFLDKAETEVWKESYRLPLYGWALFPVAESGQINTFNGFNQQQQADGEREWKYKWITMMDDDVCPICEEYGDMEPQYLDMWPDDPGGVHISCRCDLEPISPDEEEAA